MKKQFIKSGRSQLQPMFGLPIKLKNPLNQDIWFCNDLNEVYSVDGVEYVRVFKKETPGRSNLMRKSALHRVS